MRILGFWLSISIFILSASVAAAADNPCAIVGHPPGRHPAARVRLDKDVAIYIAKHAQRACGRLAKFVEDNSALVERARADSDISAIVAELRSEIMEPIIRAYPDLRGADLTQHPTPVADKEFTNLHRDRCGKHAAQPARLGRRTALHFERAFGAAEASFLATSNALMKKVAPDQSKALAEQISDAETEIEFGRAPIYASFPDLWHRVEKKAVGNHPARTPERDAAFRKVAPKRGSVIVSQAALDRMKALLASLKCDVGPNDEIVGISWAFDEKTKGPNDTEWRKLASGVQIGTYSRRSLPPDVIRTFDGLPVVFGGGTAARFAGKIVDFRDGYFVLRDK